MEIALSSKTKTKQNKKTNTKIIKNKENFKSNLVLVMILQSKGHYWLFWRQGVGLWVNNKVFSIDFMESTLMF